LGPSPSLAVSTPNLSDQDKLDFLSGDFQLIIDVKKLPAPIVRAFTEEGGSRLTIVNPGKRFRATDVVMDPSLPNKRLMLAGVSKEKCFLELEQGGIGLSHDLILFRMSSPNEAQVVWRGGCQGASLQDLRDQIRKGNCSYGH